jgi:hypothetical protein
VRDDFGRWAFNALIPDPAEKIEYCKRWLKWSDPDSRLRILQYLVELTPGFLPAEARRALTDLVYSSHGAGYETAWREIADVLAEPLYAARYRVDVILACVERAVAGTFGAVEFPPSLRKFVVACCEGDRTDLVGVLSECAERADASSNLRLKAAAVALRSGELADAWLGEKEPRADVAARNLREVQGRPPAPLQLIVGEAIWEDVERLFEGGGRGRLVERLGVPLPKFELKKGGELPIPLEKRVIDEVETDREDRDHEIELRLAGQHVALGWFHPPLYQVLARDRKRLAQELAFEGPRVYNGALQEVVFWVDGEVLNSINWPGRRWGLDEALLDWLERELRRNANLFFDFDLLYEFIRDIASRLDITRLLRDFKVPVLRRVVVSLVEEQVPLWTHRFELVKELQQIVGIAKGIDTLTQRLRETVAADLSRTFLSGADQLALIALDDRLEEELVNRLVPGESGDYLRLSTAEARRLTAAAQRHLVRTSSEVGAVPVVITLPLLRRPLFDVFQSFDRRIYTLTFTDLSPRVRFWVAGRLSEGVLGPGHE